MDSETRSLNSTNFPKSIMNHLQSTPAGSISHHTPPMFLTISTSPTNI
eukprot:CAMPEP_0197305554 /NCGR_PEP_ID=MMETSP0891-20130614/1726_1 /TAXON_ID=44058 ORGANISM="Aureoumbra lagunensis, Strain CCMP1510" /NCGR_SAMPLE_ID=MMETSP0891 /ASSEMBLY_ACC=CAM_ASM_000534 /LENGTH=47 /DNA_ID= /DNA_START= /DNA_END= /DNA_ORIENTATION=